MPGLSLPVTSSYVPPAIASPNPEPARRLSGLRCIRRQTQHKQHPAAFQDGVGPENGHAHLPPYSPSEDAQGDLLRLEEHLAPLGTRARRCKLGQDVDSLFFSREIQESPSIT